MQIFLRAPSCPAKNTDGSVEPGRGALTGSSPAHTALGLRNPTTARATPPLRHSRDRRPACGPATDPCAHLSSAHKAVVPSRALPPGGNLASFYCPRSSVPRRTAGSASPSSPDHRRHHHHHHSE